MWLIVPNNKLAELDAINDQFTDRKCTTVETIDGVILTLSDKLSDEYWTDYHVFLSSLSEFVGTPNFPQSVDN